MGIHQMIGSINLVAPPVNTGDIAESLRFRTAANASLSKTLVAGSATKWTFSDWVKRGTLGVANYLFSVAQDTTGTNQAYLGFMATDALEIRQTSPGSSTITFQKTTTRLFRDPTAYIHLVVSYDSANVVAEDRLIIWVNGERVTSFSTNTNPAQNLASMINAARGHSIGRFHTTTTVNFDGYMSRVAFVDGQVLPASSFGQLNSAGQWITKSQATIKAIVDSSGANNCLFDFTDGSSLTTIGNDLSSHDNDWTAVGFNLNYAITGSVVPDMTSNTAPSGIVTASSEYGAAYAGWIAFDRASATGNGWVSSVAVSTPQTLDYEFGDGPKTVVAYSLSSVAAAQINGSPTAWTIEGWNGSTWDVLHTVTSQPSWAGYETRVFTLPAAATYPKFRFRVTNCQGGTAQLIRLCEWALADATMYSAPATYDWMKDTPSNNYCTLNPSDGSGGTISNANLKWVGSAATASPIRSTIAVSKGKWYCEATNGAAAANALLFGIKNMDLPLTASLFNTADSGVGYYSTNGNKYVNGVATAYGTTYATGDVIAMALDMDALTVEFFKQTGGAGAFVSQGVISGIVAGTYSVGFEDGSSTASITVDVNFGQRPFNGTPPTDFLPFCTGNLPEPDMLMPSDNFDIALNTGANIKASSEALFSGNVFEWIKDRVNANNHQLIDAVRGLSAVIQSNTEADETTYVVPVGDSVGWVWKLGGAAVPNNDGTIASLVSVNADAGISCFTYTGNGVNGATVGHGLGGTPAMAIVKHRNLGAVRSAPVKHQNNAAGTNVYLDTNAAEAAVTGTLYGGIGDFVNTLNLSLVNGSTNGSNCNFLNINYVGWVFREVEGFSKAGNYVGNGAASGPFINCGFTPELVIVRGRSATRSWLMQDAERPGYNPTNQALYADLTQAQAATGIIDIVSNGFKIRSTDQVANTSGSNYLYMAFAKNPFKYANAR